MLRAVKRKWLRKEYLIWWTLLGAVLGICLGGSLYSLNCSKLTIELIGYPGELMIRALQELVLPLMALALMSGIFNLRSTRDGTVRIARWSLIYYLISMLLAVTIGILLVYSIKPGSSTPFSGSGLSSCSSENSTSTSGADQSAIESLLNIGRTGIPTNIISAAAASNYLAVIVFSVVIATAFNTLGEKADIIIQPIEVCYHAVMKIVFAVICLTPLGVASLTASMILKVCSLGLLMKSLALYIATVMAGLVIHALIVLPLTVFVLSRQNPLAMFRSFFPAIVLGLSTSSSAASMPVTMDCGEAYGCQRSIVHFVIPFGTNVNRDGTALYEAVAVIFICQAHGVSLSAGNIIVIVITATLAAIGTASIPNAGLVSLVTVLQAVSMSQYVNNIAILFAVDWLLGAVRTAVNICGDACACIIVDHWEKQHAKKSGSVNEEPEIVDVSSKVGQHNQYVTSNHDSLP